jgi:hypothetical protein
MVRSFEQPKMAVCVITAAILLLVFSPRSWGAAADEWKKVVEAAKKEGKVVVSIPASSELRKQMEPIFEQRFPGIDLELHSGTASAMQRKISDEFAAGVRYFDLHMGGAVTMINGFVGGQIVDPIEPNLLLPEVIDAKNWWVDIWLSIRRNGLPISSQLFWSLAFGTIRNWRTLRSFALTTIFSVQNGKARLVGWTRDNRAQAWEFGSTCGNTKARTT